MIDFRMMPERAPWRKALHVFLIAITLFFTGCATRQNLLPYVAAEGDYALKREFRGAWMQIVNGQYNGMTSAQQQKRLLDQLDALQRAGVNAVFFQVRAEADAFYISYYEPWSRFLTGEQGKVPDADWDPLQFMITACHARGMELHAWINPYRARMKGLNTVGMHYKHPYFRFPERFVEYDGMLLFNPASQLNRDYICTVVSDIVKRYDVDGIHIDDYFYPYPVAGVPFPDDADFAADPRGFTDKADWRRDNVNLLVRQLSTTVHGIKPWLKFGVSPFGIYHNGTPQDRSSGLARNSLGAKKIPGSATSGLQNYDDLYADVLYWIRKGWVDYTVPQLYWDIGHPRADYATLVTWWAANAGGRPLFIGQDLDNSLQQDQLAAKFQLMHDEPVSGYCWWYADAVRKFLDQRPRRSGYQPVGDAFPHTLALQPTFPFLDNKAPGPARKLGLIKTDDGPVLMWTAPKYKTELDRPIRYVVYRFALDEPIDLNNGARIIGLTPNCYFRLGSFYRQAVFVVTALDRLQNESRPARIKVRNK